MKFATFDSFGYPTAFYSRGVHGKTGIPRCAVQISDAQWGRLVENQGALRWNGTEVVDVDPSSAEAPPASAPAAITPLQARKALRSAGLKAHLDAYVAGLSEAEQEEWEYATLVERSHPVIVNGGIALGLSEQQIDELFVLGATL